MELQVQIQMRGNIFNGKSPELILDELTAAMYEGIALTERNIKKHTPVGVYGAQGGLLSQIHGEVIAKGTPVIKGVIGHNSPYGDIIEKGRQANKTWPPEGALLRWMEVKLGMDDKAARKMEFVLRRKIGKKGFEGAQMFEKGLEESLAGLQDIFDRRGFSIVRKLNE